MQIIFSNNKSIKPQYNGNSNNIIYLPAIHKTQQHRTYGFIFPYKKPACCK